MIVLLALTVATLGLLVGTSLLERELASRIQWCRGSVLRALALGSVCAVLIASPGLLLVRTSGEVAPPVLASGALLVFCLVGNAYEELLFRGFLQEHLRPRVGDARAAWISGLAFAFGHVPLATSVTSLGWPVLAFTAYEGVICAQLYRRTGLLGAAVAHGGGIFLLASGLL